MGYNPFKRQSDVLLAVVESRTVTLENTFVNEGYGSAPHREKAWGLDISNQVKDKRKKGTGRYIQFVGELNADPIRLFGDNERKTTKAVINAIADEVTAEAVAYEQHRTHIGPLKWVGVIGILLTLGFIAQLILRMLL